MRKIPVGETITVCGVPLVAVAEQREDSCLGCAGDYSPTLCAALPCGCSASGIIWIEQEASQP